MTTNILLFRLLKFNCKRIKNAPTCHIRDKMTENVEKGLKGRLNVSRWFGIIDISGGHCLVAARFPSMQFAS